MNTIKNTAAALISAALLALAGTAHAQTVDMKSVASVGALGMASSAAQYRGTLNPGEVGVGVGLGAYSSMTALAAGLDYAADNRTTISARIGGITGLTNLGTATPGGIAISVGMGFKF
jgi:hypothetical protein